MISNPSPPTRHSLIKRLKNWEDQKSWNDFFETYWRLIYSVAIKAGLTDAEAQDVVQETVLTVAKKIHEFQVGRERGSFKAWLLQTTRWRIADQFRKRPSTPCRAPGEPSRRTATVERVPDPASLNLDQVWDQNWEQNLLDVALERIKRKVDPQTFQLFHLHIIKQRTAETVATTVGVRTSQVYAAKYKVSPILKREIDRLKKEIL